MFKSGDVKQFKQLSKFENLKEFNCSVEQFLLDSPFTKAETIAFKRLVRYSAKIPGVCYAKIQTIVSATHNNGQGISRSTFERMLRKAIKAEIVEVHHTVNKSKWKRHNVYVFNPYSNKDVSDLGTKEVSNDVKIDVSNKANINQTNINKTEDKRKGDEKQSPHFDSSFVSSHIPKQFVNIVGQFFDDAQAINHLWGRLTLASNKHGYNGMILAEMDKYIKSFKESIYRHKQGKIKGAFAGYLYGVWKKTTQQIVMQSEARKGIYFDWLAE